MKKESLFDYSRLEYIASFAAILLALMIVGVYSTSSALLLSAEMSLIILFLIYTYIYFYKAHEWESLYRNAGHLIAALIFAIFAAMMILPKGAQGFLVPSLLYNIELIGLVFLYYAPLLALAFGAFYFLRGHKRRVIGIALLLLLVAVLVFYIYVIRYPLDFVLNDEMAIGFLSAHSLFQGVNPYTSSFFAPLINNVTTIGITLTTNNSFIDKLGYPAMYLYANIPFYLLTHFSFANVLNVDLKAEAISYMFLLILVMYYLDRRKGRKDAMPNIYVMFFFMLVITDSLSMVMLLMLAVILLSYFKIDKWYSFALLGIAAALQQELWLPVILLIVYAFNTYGYKKGARIFAGTASVFLALNAYFIALSPKAFFGSLFSPLNAYIFPDSLAPFGYYLLVHFHMLLSSFFIVDAGVIAIIILLFKVLNKKQLIPLLSMLPFLFFDRSSSSYYVFFGFMFVFALTVMDKRAPAKRRRVAKVHRDRSVYIGAMLVLIAFIAVYVIYSHASFERGFNISVSNQTLYTSGNSTYYNATLHYRNISNMTVYFVMFGTLDNYTNLFGLQGYRFLQSPHYANCNAFACSFNPNVFLLNGSGEEELDVSVPNGKLSSIQVMLYSNEYFYAAKSVYLPNK
ncbi:MAG: hypothetical protein QXR73_01660 [Candidatus Micrarchaeaceae archaeon]